MPRTTCPWCRLRRTHPAPLSSLLPAVSGPRPPVVEPPPTTAGLGAPSKLPPVRSLQPPSALQQHWRYCQPPHSSPPAQLRLHPRKQQVARTADQKTRHTRSLPLGAHPLSREGRRRQGIQGLRITVPRKGAYTGPSPSFSFIIITSPLSARMHARSSARASARCCCMLPAA